MHCEQNLILVIGERPLNLVTGDHRLFFQEGFFHPWIKLFKYHIIGGGINNIPVDCSILFNSLKYFPVGACHRPHYRYTYTLHSI